MIENQNLIFRPWASMPNSGLESTDTFYHDKLMFTDATTNMEKFTNLSKSSLIKADIKSFTDADRLKRMLLNEKTNEKSTESKKSEKLKDGIKIEQKLNGLSNGNERVPVIKKNSPASSSAETRLINSKIAALSSASQILSFEAYNSLHNPINTQIAAQLAAAASVSSIRPNAIPLNFILPHTNLPVQNGLANVNDCNLNNPKIDILSNHILPPTNSLPLHQLPSSNPNLAINNLPPNSLHQPNLPLPANQLPLRNPQPLLGNTPVTPILSQLPSTSVSFSANQWHHSEIVNSSVHQQANLIPSNQCISIPTSLIENSHLTNNHLSDVLVGDIKKLNAAQFPPKKSRPKNYLCLHCKQGFANSGQLRGHIRTHTGERPFACDHPNCNKRFTRNEELTRHKKIHSGVRPFHCPVCSKAFGRKDHLKKHVKTHTKVMVASQLSIPLMPIWYL